MGVRIGRQKPRNLACKLWGLAEKTREDHPSTMKIMANILWLDKKKCTGVEFAKPLEV
jgi:hypothetical protein